MRAKRLPRLPDRIENAPQLKLGLEFFWEAYADLSTCRPPAFAGLSPIPWADVDRWAQRYGVVDEQFERLWYFTRSLDAVMAKWVEKKESQNR